MAARSEISHEKNVANFDVLIAFVLSKLAVFKPSKSSIQLPSLQYVSQNAKNAMKLVFDAFSVNSSAIAARKVAFAPFSKLITRVINSLESTDTSSMVDDQARTIVRKLQGTRATPKKTAEEKKALEAEGKVVNEKSNAQLGFDDRIANFDKLISLLASIPLYTPNEPELQVAGLTAHYNNLKTLNDTVVSTHQSYVDALLLRHEVFYQQNSGLVDLAMDTKSYIRSLFGASSPEYKQISKLRFTVIKS